jgi:hypothetical protein
MAAKKKPEVKIPTPQEQHEFSQRFKQSEWDYCVNFPQFIEAVQNDLAQAEKIAVKILVQYVQTVYKNNSIEE